MKKNKKRSDGKTKNILSRWLFNSFLTKMLIRSSNVAFATNVPSLGDGAKIETEIFRKIQNIIKNVNTMLPLKFALLPNECYKQFI